jgi:hypothetical protein
VQFHPEVTPEIIAAWADHDHGDLARAGVARSDLDAATARFSAPAVNAADQLFDGFAARAGLAVSV